VSVLPRTRAQLARFVDHTILKPEATAAEIDRLCDEAVAHGFFAVCVNPVWVARCVERLGGAGVSPAHSIVGTATGPPVRARSASEGTPPPTAATRILPVVCTVAGFPLGASLPQVKAEEARRAVEQGAREVDMVVNLGALIAGDRPTVVGDIAAVVETTKRANPAALVKVILETRALTDEQIILGCQCCIEARADFVKTSTGFHAKGGATVEHAALLKKHAAPLKVKAAGGIRDLPTALAMLEAGADRLGMSASVAVVSALPA